MFDYRSRVLAARGERIADAIARFVRPHGLVLDIKTGEIVAIEYTPEEVAFTQADRPR